MVSCRFISIAAKDKQQSATFLSSLLGLPEQGVAFWADPGMRRPNEINTNHGGGGIYFDDPSDHHFELITQPYGADL